MDVNKTSSKQSLEQRYAEIAAKTAAVIAAERSASPSATNGTTVQPVLPQLPRYQPPAPSISRRLLDYGYMDVRMFFPSSGYMGFDVIKSSTELPPLDIVRAMITYETHLRLCDSIQQLMDEYHHDGGAVTFIHDLIQQHVVEHFGYYDVNALRTALFRFPDDPVIKAAFYVKYNKISQGQINQGQCTRNVDLYTPDGQCTTLFTQITAGQPLVILAGSMS
ncbi:hypothetical protein I4U23_016522 [Adineta vaga]|nr:hypothetical protein I4U23_016522 [Adineta vaga]